MIATDIDDYSQAQWPPRNHQYLSERTGADLPGMRFGLAHEELGSRVERIGCSVYELTAERIGGPVDFVVVGDLLLHLRDPVGGLEAVRALMRPGAGCCLPSN